MGYRSDVKAVFYTSKEKWPMLKLYVDEHFPEELKGSLSIVGERGYLFQDNNVKWYDSWPEVQAFNRFVSNFLELADEDSDEARERAWAYEFVRIGEDSDDLEETYSDGAEYVLSVIRDVEVCI